MSDIPATNEIKMFMHCGECLPQKPAGVSPAEWARLSCGFTAQGIQVWCLRCDVNVIHMDLEGQRHPATTGRERRTVQ